MSEKTPNLKLDIYKDDEEDSTKFQDYWKSINRNTTESGETTSAFQKIDAAYADVLDKINKKQASLTAGVDLNITTESGEQVVNFDGSKTGFTVPVTDNTIEAVSYDDPISSTTYKVTNGIKEVPVKKLVWESSSCACTESGSYDYNYLLPSESVPTTLPVNILIIKCKMTHEHFITAMTTQTDSFLTACVAGYNFISPVKISAYPTTPTVYGDAENDPGTHLCDEITWSWCVFASESSSWEQFDTYHTDVYLTWKDGTKVIPDEYSVQFYDGVKNDDSCIHLTSPATTSKLGSIKVGTNLSVTSDGTLSAAGTAGAGIISITHDELVALRDAGTLTPGQEYRITDYCPTYYANDKRNGVTVEKAVKFAGHAVDIIVTADSASIVNMNCRFALHAGDTYFASSSVEKWEGKYILDDKSDTSDLSFQEESGESFCGFILWLKDNANNECSYDFKNLMYRGSALYGYGLGLLLQEAIVENQYYYTFDTGGGDDSTVYNNSLNHGYWSYDNKVLSSSIYYASRRWDSVLVPSITYVCVYWSGDLYGNEFIGCSDVTIDCGDVGYNKIMESNEIFYHWDDSQFNTQTIHSEHIIFDCHCDGPNSYSIITGSRGITYVNDDDEDEDTLHFSRIENVDIWSGGPLNLYDVTSYETKVNNKVIFRDSQNRIVCTWYDNYNHKVGKYKTTAADTTWTDIPGDVDAFLSTTSENAVQNKVVTAALNTITGYMIGYMDDIAAGLALVPATSSVLGGIKVGDNLSIATDGTLSAAASALAPASDTVLGGAKTGYTTIVKKAVTTGTPFVDGGVMSAVYINLAVTDEQFTQFISNTTNDECLIGISYTDSEGGSNDASFICTSSVTVKRVSYDIITIYDYSNPGSGIGFSGEDYATYVYLTAACATAEGLSKGNGWYYYYGVESGESGERLVEKVTNSKINLPVVYENTQIVSRSVTGYLTDVPNPVFSNGDDFKDTYGPYGALALNSQNQAYVDLSNNITKTSLIGGAGVDVVNDESGTIATTTINTDTDANVCNITAWCCGYAASVSIDPFAPNVVDTINKNTIICYMNGIPASSTDISSMTIAENSSAMTYTGNTVDVYFILDPVLDPVTSLSVPTLTLPTTYRNCGVKTIGDTTLTTSSNFIHLVCKWVNLSTYDGNITKYLLIIVDHN